MTSWQPGGHRFWNRVDQSGGTESCWPWRGYRNLKGYGSLSVESRRYQAHRFAYELFTSETISSDLMVLHSCDNPPCCNPRHLRIGTAAENSADMVARGRSPLMRNERSGKAKLTDRQVAAIRSRWSQGESMKSLGHEFGVHPAHVGRIVRGSRRPVEDGGPLPRQQPRTPRPRTRQPSSEWTARMEQQRREQDEFWAHAIELYESGLSTIDVGRRIGRDESNVSRRLRRLGVVMRTNESYVKPLDCDEVRRLHGEGIRVAAMVRRLGVCRKRIEVALDEMGLPRFSSGRLPNQSVGQVAV